jgi:hypothetical protein
MTGSYFLDFFHFFLFFSPFSVVTFLCGKAAALQAQRPHIALL